MSLPSGIAGFVHGIPGWFTKLTKADSSQAPPGTSVYAQNVDIVDRVQRLLGKVGIQVGNVDISPANPIPVDAGVGGAVIVVQPIHGLLNCNANIQIADVDVGVANPVPISAAALPLPPGAATAANQVTMITALQLIDDLRNALDSVATDELHTKEQVGLVIDEHDFIDCGYDVNGNLTSAVYKTGGAGGATVATLTLTYDGSGNLDTVTKI